MLVLDRQRDRARPGADVEHARSGLGTEQLEAALDDDLGLGPGDEGARVRLQDEPAKAPFTEHVRERLPLAAPSQQDPPRIWHVAVGLYVHAASGRAEHVREQQLRVDARRVDTGGGELTLRDSERFPHRHSPSARRRSSAVSASVNSSSSPCSTRSSWCVVSLIRWSVIRFSGKL